MITKGRPSNPSKPLEGGLPAFTPRVSYKRDYSCADCGVKLPMFDEKRPVTSTHWVTDKGEKICHTCKSARELPEPALD